MQKVWERSELSFGPLPSGLMMEYHLQVSPQRGIERVMWSALLSWLDCWFLSSSFSHILALCISLIISFVISVLIFQDTVYRCVPTAFLSVIIYTPHPLSRLLYLHVLILFCISSSLMLAFTRHTPWYQNNSVQNISSPAVCICPAVRVVVQHYTDPLCFHIFFTGDWEVNTSLSHDAQEM